MIHNMILNYDTKTGSWGTFLDNFKQEIKYVKQTVEREISPEIREAFSQMDDVTPFSMWSDVGLDDEGLSKLKDTSLKEFVDGLSEAEKQSLTAGEALQRLSTTTMTVAQKTSKASAVFKSFGNAVKTALGSIATMAAIYAISAAIDFGITAIDNYIHRSERLIEAGEKAKEEIASIGEEYNKKSSFVDNSGDRFIELSAGVKQGTNENISLTNEEYKEYLSLSNQMKDLFPQLVSGWDSQSNAIISLGDNADTASASLEALLENERKIADLKISNNLQTAFDGTIEKSKILYNSLKDTETKIVNLERAKDATKDVENNADKLGIKFNKIGDNNDQLFSLDFSFKYGDDFSNDLYNNNLEIFTKSLEAAGMNYVDNVVTFQNAISDGTQVIGETTTRELKGTEDQLKAFNDAFLSFLQDSDYISEELVDAYILQESDKKEIQANWNSLVPSLISAMSVYEGYNELDDSIKQRINTLIGEIDPLEEWTNENGEWVEPESIRAYLREIFIDPFEDILESDVPNIKESISSLFNIDTSELTLEEYKEQLDNILQTIKAAFDEIYGDSGEEKYNEFLLRFGFKIVDENGDIVDSKEALLNKIQDIAELNGEDPAELGLDELTVDQLIKLEAIVDEESYGGLVQEAIDNVVNNVQDTIDSNPITLSSLLAPDAEGKQSELSKLIDTFQSDMKTLQDAKDAFNNGETVNVTDLTQEFGVLISQTDDLGKSLSNLQVTKLQEFSDKVKEITAGIDNPEELSKFLADLFSTIDLSGVEMPDLKKLIFDKMVSGKENLSMNAISSIEQYVDNLLAKYGNTEFTKEILFTLTFANSEEWAHSDWEKYIQDLIPIAQLRESEKALTSLKVSMSGLISEASELQNELSFKQTAGIKPVVSDYQKLINNSRAQVQNLQKQNEELQKQQTHLDETDQKYWDIQSEINSNVSAIDSARNSQIEWNDAVSQLSYDPNEGLVEYNKAKGTRNGGSNYLDMLDAAKEAQEAREKGLIGTDDFKTVAKMFSPNGMDDVGNWDENYGKITRYFTEDESGALNFLNDLSEKTNDVGKSLASFDENTKTWTYNIDDVQASADALGISFEAFLAIMGRLQDYGFSNDYFSSVEDGEAHLGDLYGELVEAETKLDELRQKKSDGDTTVTDAVLAAQEAKVDSIRNSIVQTEDLLSILQSKEISDYEANAKAAAKTADNLIKYLSDPKLTDAARYQIENELNELTKYGIKFEYDTDTGHIIGLADSTQELLQDKMDENPIEVKYSDIDLKNRPKVSSETMREAGWEDVGEGYATVYSSSYSNEDGTKTVVVTPILPDGSVLDPGSLEYYANKALDGEEIDVPIKLGEFNGEDSITQAENYSQALRLVQEAYYSEDESLRSLLESLGEYNKTELKSINYGDRVYDTGFEDTERAVGSILDTLGLSEDQAYVLIDILGEMGLIEVGVETNLDGEEVSSEVSEVIDDAQSQADENPVDIIAKVAAEKIELPDAVDIGKAVTFMGLGFTGLFPSGETKNYEANITANDKAAIEAIDNVVEYAKEHEATIPLTADDSLAFEKYTNLFNKINTDTAQINIDGKVSLNDDTVNKIKEEVKDNCSPAYIDVSVDENSSLQLFKDATDRLIESIPSVELDANINEETLNEKVTSTVKGITPPDITINGNIDKEELNGEVSSAITGIVSPDISVGADIQKAKDDTDQAVKYVESQTPKLNVGVNLSDVDYEEYLKNYMTENPDLHMGFSIDEVSDEEFSVIASNFQKIADENRPTINVDGDTTSLEESAEESVENIESQEPVMQIDGDGSGAVGEGIATKNVIESMDPVMNVSANTDGMVSDIDAALKQGVFEFNAIAHVSVSESGSSSTTGVAGQVFGTAHAKGTVTSLDLWSGYRHSMGAYAEGSFQDWSLPQDENALVNEVGINNAAIF